MRACFAQQPSIDQVVIYGSRAMGTYRAGSDIDLTLLGELSFGAMLQLTNQLDALLLPYKIDLSIRRQITNPALNDHIERVGQVLYDKNAFPQTIQPKPTKG